MVLMDVASVRIVLINLVNNIKIMNTALFMIISVISVTTNRIDG